MSDSRRLSAPSGPPLETQVLVIGSGAGGAITAATLAKLGHEVLLLEEGPDVDTAEIASNSTDAMQRLYRNGGLTPIMGNQSIAFVEGRCVGGSTEINSGFWHRLPEHCYFRWTSDALLDEFTPETLEAYFDRIEADLHVSRPTPEQQPRSAELFREGADRLGWDVAEVRRCQKDPTASPFAPGAKQSMQRTYLPRAVRSGVRIVANCKVRQIEHDAGRVSGVQVTWSDDGRPKRSTIRAETVFVCGGAIQTPVLLRRSGIRRNVGNNLCIHPMIKAAALFDDEVGAHDAVLPMYQVSEFRPTISLGGSVTTPGFLAMLLSDNWEANRQTMHDWSRMAIFYAAIRGMNHGRVRALPGVGDGAVLRYRLSAADQRNLSIGLARLGELLFAAGATAVYPSLRSYPVLRSVEQCRSFLKSYIPIPAMSLSTVHAFSSCPMGENPDFCATDSFGRVRGFDNLHINDASLLPDSPGVNPQGTIMAIALRNAERFAERTRRMQRLRKTSKRSRKTKPDVLVTGAPGWLGTRLVEVLSDRRLTKAAGLALDTRRGRVRCLVRRGTDPSLIGEVFDRADLAPGDLTDPDSLRELCRDAEGATLFHIAGVIHPTQGTKEFEQVNVDGTRRLIEAAVEAGVKRVVAVSSNSPVGCNPRRDHLFDESSPYHPYLGYGRSKARMEQLVQEARADGRIEAVIIRPPWFYGPHQPARQTRFFQMIKQGRFPILGDGEQMRSMAYVDNICQGLLLAATSAEADGETYWIADDRPYSINEIVETVASVLEEFGIPCSKGRLRLPSLLGDVGWLADRAVQGLGLYNQEIHVLGEMNKTIACSIDKAKGELGYVPRFSLREGMAVAVRWCLENGQPI